MSATHVIQKYLSNYAERDIQSLSLKNHTRYEAVCVVPIYDECFQQLLSFLSIETTKKVAFIWVVNCPDNGDPEAIKRTQKLVLAFQKHFVCSSLSDNIFLTPVRPNIDLYLMDRCLNGDLIPAKQGVGLARKLGMDLALALVSQYVSNDIWLHSCDADVSIPSNYFDIPKPKAGQSVCLYPFKHIAEEGYEMQMRLYDFKLRYYQQQLAFAGSPYAFYTIGSIIALTPIAYAQVRGVPKRSAGEDFYLLNKLAKVGRIKSLVEPYLKVTGRPSTRVPFGTGPALVELREMQNAGQNYRYYHPGIFIVLKAILDTAKRENGFVSLSEFYRAVETEIRSVGVQIDVVEQVRDVLNRLGFEEKFDHIRNGGKPEQCSQRFHTWFDAFLTLKFVHAMRDKVYSNLNLEELAAHDKVISKSEYTDLIRMFNCSSNE